jgi:acyl dehydratase
MIKTADKMQPGDTYEPLILSLSAELNEQFLQALDAQHDRYHKIVHPGVLLNFCSITQSPSFCVQDQVAAVAAKFGCTFVRPTQIGEKVRISWKVCDVYERRSRLYQIAEVLVEAELDGSTILRREINNTFIGGQYLGKRVKWEKETGYRRALNKKGFPRQGYEIVGKRKTLTMEKLQQFSGGIPGLGWPARNIHTDREFSIRSGIGRPVASGFMFEAYLQELLIDFTGESWFGSGRLQVTAIEMAGDGDTVIPKATIEASFAEGANRVTQYHVWVENQYGNTVMIGSASFKNAV